MCASLFLTCLDAKQSLHLMQEEKGTDVAVTPHHFCR